METFQKPDLPILAFPVLEDIRRQGKLCDVTLKVALYALDIKIVAFTELAEARFRINRKI